MVSVTGNTVRPAASASGCTTPAATGTPSAANVTRCRIMSSATTRVRRRGVGSAALTAARASQAKFPIATAAPTPTPMRVGTPPTEAPTSADSKPVALPPTITRVAKSPLLILITFDCPGGTEDVHKAGGDPEHETDHAQPRQGHQPSIQEISTTQPDHRGDHEGHPDL